ncbi:MAG TPA: DUF4350 domain-containing protein [Mycobacteriales bacterium]|nr:DUF4350 domain-containing protein [Mycobacteriales bacterium]
MTATVVAPPGRDEAVPASATRAITGRQAWQAARLPVVLGALVLLASGVIALLSTGATGELLDPEAARPLGGKALAVVLESRGVEVLRVTEPGRSTDVTTFVPRPELLSPDVDLASLVPAAGRDVVLVSPGPDLLALISAELGDATVDVVGDTEVETRSPRCGLGAAQSAGRALTGGEVYRAAGGTSCYAAGDGATVLVLERDGGRLVVVGAPDLFTNAELDEEGNAALALGLLSARAQVEWVYPRDDERAALGQRRRPLLELLPDVVVLAAAQLGLAAVWLGLWRARRLGPVVDEPLPVVVRAAETVEGRARLYRAARARAPAAAALQAATRRRLSVPLGLGNASTRVALGTAVAERTGRTAADVDDLLYGRVPADDAALVRLARELDVLDSEVRRP